MACIFLGVGLHFSDRNELCLRELLPDGLGCKGQYLSLPGISGERQRLHESPRAVAPVAIIEAQGIARIGEFIHAEAALQARPDSRAAEDLIGPGTDSIS